MLGALVNAINSTQGIVERVRSSLAGASFTVGPVGISIRAGSRPVASLLDLFSALGRSGDRFVIAMDEVQEVAAASPRLLKVLGNVFNSYRNVQFVFSGSNFGLIRTLLEAGMNSPLYGRPPARLVLRPFSREVSQAFLREGCARPG